MPRCYMVKKQNPTKQYSGAVKDRVVRWHQNQNNGAPESPTEGCVAPLCYTSLTTRKAASLNHLPSSATTITINDSPSNKPETSNSVVAMGNFQSRSQEETEAAHDLLSLSQSLPPLPAPSVVKIHHTLPSEDNPSSPSTTYITSEKTTNNKHRIVVYSRKTKESVQNGHQQQNPQYNQPNTRVIQNPEIIELSDDDSGPFIPQKFIKIEPNLTQSFHPLQTATLTPLQTNISTNAPPKPDNRSHKTSLVVNPVATLTPTPFVMTTPSYSQPIVYVVQMPVTPPTSESSNDGTNESMQIIPNNFQLVSDLTQDNQDILILPLSQEPLDPNCTISTNSGTTKDIFNKSFSVDATLTPVITGFKNLQNDTTATTVLNGTLCSAYPTNSMLLTNDTSENTDNISTNNTNISTINTNISTINTNISTNNTNISTINTNISTNNTNYSSTNGNPANLIRNLPDRRKKRNRPIASKPPNVPVILPDDIDSDSKQSYIDVEAMSPSPNNIVSFGTGAKTKFFKVVEEEVEEEVDSDVSEDDDPKTGKYCCSDCGKTYATSSNLSRHKQTHRNLDSQSAKKCHTCGKAYVSMPALAMHLLTHKLAHSCSICGKQFSRPWLLQGHLRSHTGEKPYGCAHCGKAFADRSNLRAHMQTHSQDKQFKCPGCQKTFALKSYLHKHLESTCMWDAKSKNLKTNNAETQTIVLE